VKPDAPAPAAAKGRKKKNGKGPSAAETLAATVARAPEPVPPAAPAPAPVPAPAEDAQADSWRVTTRQVIALLHEVERLREVRLRLEERRREIDKSLQQLDRLGIQAETAEARSLLLGIRRPSAPTARRPGTSSRRWKTASKQSPPCRCAP